MRKLKKMIIPLFVLFTMMCSMIPTSYGAFDDRCNNVNEVYVEGAGCVVPKFIFDTYQEEYNEKESLGSYLGGEQIDTLKISNPWAAQGQPVIVKFTLQNDGDKFGYPYNQIDLPPNNYVLMMGVDKDLGVRDKNGVFQDIFSEFTWWEKFVYLAGSSYSQFSELATKSLKGEQCGYVDIYNLKWFGLNVIPARIKERASKEGWGGIMVWQCLKIVDKPYFANELKRYCKGEINEECLQSISGNINNDMVSTATDTVTVLLTDGNNGQVPKGQCVRPYQNIGRWAILGQALAPFVKWNIVECSLGKNGLQPGEKVTFDFVVLIPKDSPVVNPRNFEDVQNGLYQTEEGQVYTFSPVCEEDINAKACHSIYSGVYPAKTDNLATILVNNAQSLLQFGSCSWQYISSFGASKYDQCMATRGFSANAVGDPIWEGSGTFYIIGPILSGSIELLLWGAIVAGGLTGFGLTPGKS